MTNRMPCNIEDGPDYEEPVYDRPEPDPDEARDDLILTLEDIATGLDKDFMKRKQAE